MAIQGYLLGKIMRRFSVDELPSLLMYFLRYEFGWSKTISESS